VDNNESAL